MSEQEPVRLADLPAAISIEVAEPTTEELMEGYDRYRKSGGEPLRFLDDRYKQWRASREQTDQVEPNAG